MSGFFCRMASLLWRATMRDDFLMNTRHPTSSVRGFGRRRLGHFLVSRLVFVEVYNADKNIKTIAKNKFIFNIKTAILDGHVDFTAIGFIKQGTNFERCGVLRGESFYNRGEGMTAIDNILNKQNVFIADINL